MTASDGPSAEMIEAAAKAISGNSTAQWERWRTLVASKRVYADAEAALAAVWPLVQARYTALEDENERLREENGLILAERDTRVLDEVRALWKAALKREGSLAAAVTDLIWKVTQYGETEDGDVAAYIVPKGTVHRLVGVAQQNGAHVPVAFRAGHVPTPADDDFAHLLAVMENERTLRIAAEAERDAATAKIAAALALCDDYDERGVFKWGIGHFRAALGDTEGGSE